MAILAVRHSLVVAATQLTSYRFFPQLLGFGSALLEKVDPNPDNYVGAGIIQTKALQVGCLLRLEPNAQAQVRRQGLLYIVGKDPRTLKL